MEPVTSGKAHQQEQSKLPAHIQDPLSRLGPDMMLMHVFGILEPMQLAQCLLVCTRWKGLAGLDVLWDIHCERLWEGKFLVPTCARKASTKLMAYSVSLGDAKRTQISEEELCSFLWGFQWKPFAGTHRQWPALAPFCGPENLKKTVFNSDHTISRVPKLRLGQSDWPFDFLTSWQWTKNKRHRPGRLLQICHRRGPGLEMQRTADWGWPMEDHWLQYDSLCSNRAPG